MNELKTLLKARSLIADPAKWGKGDDRYDNGTLCIMDALWDGDKTTCGDVMDACKEVREAAAIPVDLGLADWNDAPERTHAEVLAVLDKTIAALSSTQRHGE